MPPSTKPPKPRRSRGPHTAGRCAARAITRLLSACMDRIRTIAADLAGRDDAELDRRPHVATLGELRALGWDVTEILPDRDEPVLWRVEIKRFDGAVAIIVLDAADPDAALEELARYAAADAEDPR
jgi:hypothetical protein